MGFNVDGVQAAIDRLAEDLDRPVAIDDSDFRPLLFSPQRSSLDQVRIDSILHHDSPEAAKAWVTQQGVRDASRVRRVEESAEVGLLSRLCAPIRHEGCLLGFLWVIDSDRSLDERAVEVIADTADGVAPVLYYNRVLDVVDRRDEGEALWQLLLSDAPTQRAAAAERLVHLGVLGATAPSLVLVASGADPTGWSEGDEFSLSLVLEQSRSWVTDSQIACATRGTQGVVLLAGPAADRAPELAAFLMETCSSRLADRRWVVGIGSPRRALSDARRSYAEAKEVTRVLAAVPSVGSVVAHRELGAYAALARIPEVDLTPELIPVELQRLMSADRGGDLTVTLECYLDGAGDVVTAARQLHVHRSTVYARLERIEQASGLSMSDGRDRLTAHVGIAIARLVGRWPRLSRGR